MNNIIIAPQDSSNFLENEIDDFLQKILGFDIGECLVTDESMLCDFCGCGLPEEVEDKVSRHVELLNKDELDRNKKYSNYMEAQTIYWTPYILEKIESVYKIEVTSVNEYLVDIVRKISLNQKTVH